MVSEIAKTELLPVCRNLMNILNLILRFTNAKYFLPPSSVGQQRTHKVLPLLTLIVLIFNFSDEMKRDLLNGTTLVIDRYAYSGVAYTSAKVRKATANVYMCVCMHVHVCQK